MKKLLLLLFLLLSLSGIKLYAQDNSYDLGNGLTLVTYGNVAVINDDINKRSVSLEVVREQQEARQHAQNKVVYKVVCNKWTRRVVKEALGETIGTAISTVASPIIGIPVGLATKAAGWIYDDVCEYFEDEYGD